MGSPRQLARSQLDWPPPPSWQILKSTGRQFGSDEIGARQRNHLLIISMRSARPADATRLARARAGSQQVPDETRGARQVFVGGCCWPSCPANWQRWRRIQISRLRSGRLWSRLRAKQVGAFRPKLAKIRASAVSVLARPPARLSMRVGGAAPDESKVAAAAAGPIRVAEAVGSRAAARPSERASGQREIYF